MGFERVHVQCLFKNTPAAPRVPPWVFRWRAFWRLPQTLYSLLHAVTFKRLMQTPVVKNMNLTEYQP